jgi:hypothetical protein
MDPRSERFTFRVSGTEHTVESDGNASLVDVLRNTGGQEAMNAPR